MRLFYWIAIVEYELAAFLKDMVPVPWTKIALYAESNGYTEEIFYAVHEEMTNLVVTMDTIDERYEQDFDDSFASKNIHKYVSELRSPYENDPSQTAWREFVCVVEKNGEYKFDYFFPDMGKYNFLSREDFIMKYFDSEYYCVRGRYPSADRIIH